MHKNEAFLKKVTDEELLQLMFEAEALGKQHVVALKEQLARIGEDN